METYMFTRAFQDVRESASLRDEMISDLPHIVGQGFIGRLTQPKHDMPEVEDFLGAMRPAINEVVAVYVDHDCDGRVTTYRLFPGTSFMRDGRSGELSGDGPWHFGCGTLVEVREASAEEAATIRRDGFEMPEYIVVCDEDWFPWVEDDSRGIPALDHTLDDGLEVW